MRDIITNIYVKLNQDFINLLLFNDSKNREYIKECLETELGDEFIIKCDLENNPALLIDKNLACAKVMWKENNQHYYMDLIFGNTDNIFAYYLNR